MLFRSHLQALCSPPAVSLHLQPSGRPTGLLINAVVDVILMPHRRDGESIQKRVCLCVSVFFFLLLVFRPFSHFFTVEKTVLDEEGFCYINVLRQRESRDLFKGLGYVFRRVYLLVCVACFRSIGLRCESDQLKCMFPTVCNPQA